MMPMRLISLALLAQLAAAASLGVAADGKLTPESLDAKLALMDANIAAIGVERLVSGGTNGDDGGPSTAAVDERIDALHTWFAGELNATMNLLSDAGRARTARALVGRRWRRGRRGVNCEL